MARYRLLLQTFSLLVASAGVSLVSALHSTDTITSGGSNPRNGHQPNHNLDPAVLRSGTFDTIWKTKGLGNYNGFTEQIYAQPLIYTPPGEKQSVYVASQQNYVYRLDAVTGEILASRQLNIPFLTADLEGCNDIADCIGSTATGVIDPIRNTWFLTSKTYANQGVNKPQGLKAGRYYIHALDAVTLKERPGFPVGLEGMAADNASWRVFEGGKHHQRPALLQTGDFVYAGFASHCVQWNFTGWIVGWNAWSGDIVARFATEGGTETMGKGGGVWMSGGGIASDNPGRMFFATGNGYASQLADDPVPGRQPPTSLEEAVVNLAIAADGSLMPTDFFMPWEKRDLDGMDKDLGTSAFVLFEPDVFSTSKVKRIGAVAGKTGKLYFLNVDDLGGYQMGPNRKDAALQTIMMEGPVFSSVGTYPGEGGYVYITPVAHQTVAYKFGKDAQGNPVFTEAGRSRESAAGRQGVGHISVTSLNGAPGSGILWVVDVDGVNLRAYGTVPVNGVLPTYALLNNVAQSKFSRPTFGNGKVYVTTHTGFITAFGSPVNMPLNCSSPYDFGTVDTANTNNKTVTCKALTELRLDSVDIDDGTQFSVSGLPNLPLTLTTGNSLSLIASFGPQSVGSLSTNINFRTTNQGIGKFSSNTPVVLRGTSVSQTAVLQLQPDVLPFGEVIIGSGSSSLSFTLSNGGMTALTVSSYTFSTTPSGPWVPLLANTSYSFDPSPLPTTIAPSTTIPITVTFDALQRGTHLLYIRITTSSGIATLFLTARSGTPPKASLSFSSANGTYYPLTPFTNADFGPVLRGTTSYRTLLLRNTGDTILTTTISKPPVSGALAAVNPLGSLAEGAQIPPNSSLSAELYCAPPKSQVNMPPQLLVAQWVLNNNDPGFGKRTVSFTCAATTRQLGDLDRDGRAYWQYAGCYIDAGPSRILALQLYYSTQTENGKCTEDCQRYGYTVAGTQYEGECWCGHVLPGEGKKKEEGKCAYLCKGDYMQYCGGDGAYLSIFYDSRKWNSTDLGLDPGPGMSSSMNASTASATVSSSNTLVRGGGMPTPAPSGFFSLGCYAEPSGARLLPVDLLYSLDMTPGLCRGHCVNSNHPYAGVEYGSECWCGDFLLPTAQTLPEDRCAITCPGDNGSSCGGSNALEVWRWLEF